MKIVAKIFLFIFIAFLITPTIVSLIEKKADISIFYSLSEEETSHKSIKLVFDFKESFKLIHYLGRNSSLIHSENLSRHDAICTSIFIPPPNCFRTC